MTDTISQSDRTFMRHFTLMIIFLAVVALLLISMASLIYGSSPKDLDVVTQTTETAERIAPAGAVYAGETGRAAMAAAKAAEAAKAASQVAYGGTTDGKEIYDHLCHTCHTAGVAGAPKLGDNADWGPRIAQGMETLISHAVDGYTGPDGHVMPPKGGNPALTQEQVANAVKWIVSQSQ